MFQEPAAVGVRRGAVGRRRYHTESRVGDFGGFFVPLIADVPGLDADDGARSTNDADVHLAVTRALPRTPNESHFDSWVAETDSYGNRFPDAHISFDGPPAPGQVSQRRAAHRSDSAENAAHCEHCGHNV